VETKTIYILNKAELLELLTGKIKGMQRSIEEKKKEKTDTYIIQITKIEKLIPSHNE
jgi:hypothetical protein